MQIRVKKTTLEIQPEIMEVYMAYSFVRQGFKSEVIYMCIPKHHEGLMGFGEEDVEIVSDSLNSDYVIFRGQFSFGFKHKALKDKNIYEGLIECDPDARKKFMNIMRRDDLPWDDR